MYNYKYNYNCLKEMAKRPIQNFHAFKKKKIRKTLFGYLQNSQLKKNKAFHTLLLYTTAELRYRRLVPQPCNGAPNNQCVPFSPALHVGSVSIRESRENP